MNGRLTWTLGMTTLYVALLLAKVPLWQLALLSVILLLMYQAALHYSQHTQFKKLEDLSASLDARQKTLEERHQQLRERELPEYTTKLEESVVSWRNMTFDARARLDETQGKLSVLHEKYRVAVEIIAANPEMHLKYPIREFSQEVLQDLSVVVNDRFKRVDERRDIPSAPSDPSAPSATSAPPPNTSY